MLELRAARASDGHAQPRDAGVGGVTLMISKSSILQATAGAHSDDLHTSGVVGGPSIGGHSAFAGELLVEDDAQVEHLVLIGLRVANGLELLVWAWAYDWRWSPKPYYYYYASLGLVEMEPKALLMMDVGLGSWTWAYDGDGG